MTRRYTLDGVLNYTTMKTSAFAGIKEYEDYTSRNWQESLLVVLVFKCAIAGNKVGRWVQNEAKI